ncbi:hypothetical protein [Streptomyces violarus]|nr:hypothetical protein [Streptomyces violarus]MCT9141799.1 hypothetical protein [Streptomyces violarus]
MLVVLVLGAAVVYAAYRNPALGKAIGVGVVVATLLLALLI